MSFICISSHREPKGSHADTWKRGCRLLRISQSDRRERRGLPQCCCNPGVFGHPSHSFSILQKVIFPNQDDCLISFLPLAHMFERLIEVNLLIYWSIWAVWGWWVGGGISHILKLDVIVWVVNEGAHSHPCYTIIFLPIKKGKMKLRWSYYWIISLSFLWCCFVCALIWHSEPAHKHVAPL